MKVLFLSNDFNTPFWGASEEAVRFRTVVSGFVRAGAQVLVAARRFEPGRREQLPAGFECLQIPNKPDLLSPAFSPRLMNGRLLHWLVRLHRVFPYDLIYERHALWTTAGLEAARHLGVRHLLDVDPVILREAVMRGNPWLTGEVHVVERFLVRKADRLVAWSAPIARQLEKMGGREESILVEPDPVEDEILGRGWRAPDETKPFTIGFAGSLRPSMGIETLLEAFERLEAPAGTCALRILGGGPLESRVAEACRTHEAVTWISPLDSRALVDAIETCDVVAAPHADDVSLPSRTIAVAQALGVPVVASGGAAVRDLLENGRAGIYLPSREAAGLARALETLRRDPGLRTNLAENARRQVRDRTASRVAARLLRAVPHRDLVRQAATASFNSPSPGPAVAVREERTGTN